MRLSARLDRSVVRVRTPPEVHHSRAGSVATDSYDAAVSTPSASRDLSLLPAVVAARGLADTTARAPIVFGSVRTLETLSQFAGTDVGVTRPSGDYDGFECGAASLVAGLVMLGRSHLLAAVPLMLRRHYRALATVLSQPESSERTLALRELVAARSALERCNATGSWNMQDLRAFMRASYRVLVVSDWLGAIAANKPAPLNFTVGLSDGTIIAARDELWGQPDIEHDGRSYTVYAISYEKGGGHAVLAERVPTHEGSARVLFDPLPDPDGTATTTENATAPWLRRTTPDAPPSGGGVPMDEASRANLITRGAD